MSTNPELDRWEKQYNSAFTHTLDEINKDGMGLFEALETFEANENKVGVPRLKFSKIDASEIVRVVNEEDERAGKGNRDRTHLILGCELDTWINRYGSTFTRTLREVSEEAFGIYDALAEFEANANKIGTPRLKFTKVPPELVERFVRKMILGEKDV